VLLLEGVGDVLEEDQPQDDVLVFGGVHAAPQGIGHAPQFGLIADGGAVILCDRVPWLRQVLRLLGQCAKVPRFARYMVLADARSTGDFDENRVAWVF
jgi:hypothetical protein